MRQIPISPDARAFEARQYEEGSILAEMQEIGRLACAGGARLRGAGSVLGPLYRDVSDIERQCNALADLRAEFSETDPVVGILDGLRALLDARAGGAA